MFAHIVDQDMINAGKNDDNIHRSWVLGTSGQNMRMELESQAAKSTSGFQGECADYHNDHDDLEDGNGDDHDYIVMIGQV